MRRFIILLSALYPLVLAAQSWHEFHRVPDSVRTKVWWFHGETETTKEGITADLEAFRSAGVGGVVYYDQVYGDGANALEAFSPKWWSMFVFAAQEAKRLGLTFETHLSNGYVGGGPWVKENQGMKYLVSGDTLVKGNCIFSGVIPIQYRRGQYRAEVATVAFPVSARQWGQREIVKDTLVVGGKDTGGIYLSHDFGNTFTARSLTYEVTARARTATRAMNIPGPPADKFYGMNYMELPPLGELEASDDGIHYRKVCKVKARYASNSIWNRQTISFPATSARYFRIHLHDWSISQASDDAVRLSHVVLSSRAKIDLGEEKAGLVSNHIFGDDTPEYSSDEVIRSKDLIDLSHLVDDTGRLTWRVPPGDWGIIRFVCAPTGAMTRHGRKNLRGLECDKMSAAAADLVWRNYFKVMDDSLRAHGLKIDGLVMDSHEAGAQNWTEGFEQEFEKLRGYSLLRFLPVMAGYVVDSKALSGGVLYDVRRTVADLVSTKYYGTLDSLCRGNRTQFTAQAIGNGLCLVGDPIQAKGRVERPQSEFWHYQKESNYDIKECSSAAHLYGKPIASAEAFTDTRYNDPLSDIKLRADHAWCMGVNEFVVCASPYQPWLNTVPGNTANGWEYCLNRNNTYWPYSRPFWDYQARGNYMMRQGRSVADLCVFLGADAPIKIESYRLPDIPTGYDWDAFTEDALFTRMNARNGRVVVPGGVSYGMMVLPREGRLTLAQLKKIANMVYDGISIYGNKPLSSPSAADKDSLQQWQRLCNEMWGNANEYGVCRYGQGRIYTHTTLAEALKMAGMKPDITLESGKPLDRNLRFAHRRTLSSDIYLLDNHLGKRFSNMLHLRTSHRWAQIWDPVSGKRYIPRQQGNRVHVQLEADQTLFIVCSDSKDSLPPFPATILSSDTLSRDWTVNFDKNKGGNGENKFDKLRDWTESKCPGIRYYSGTAVYKKAFTCKAPSPGQRVFMAFDRLCDMAQVEINGKNVGIVWCSPWEIEITDYIKPGKNELRLSVTNSLNNRMVYDAGLPEKMRITKSVPMIRSSKDKLLPSGIIGNVEIRYRQSMNCYKSDNIRTKVP